MTAEGDDARKRAYDDDAGTRFDRAFEAARRTGERMRGGKPSGAAYQEVDEGGPVEALQYMKELLSRGEWTPVADITGPHPSVVDHPGDSGAFYELLDVKPREDGRFDVHGTHGESDRVWVSTYNGTDLLLLMESPRTEL